MSYIKSQEDIKYILEGGKIMGEILETLGNMVKPGVSTGAVDAEAERLIRAAGGIPAFKGYRGRHGHPPFSGTICASVNDEIVHGIPSDRHILAEGDIFSIDIGMQWPANSGKGVKGNGFFTDTAITVPVGKISPEVQKLLDVTRESLERGIAVAQSGGSIADIGKAVESYVKPFKYGIVEDLVGHGVGHGVHEDPPVPNYYDESFEELVIEPGAVLALEPMITMGSHETEMLDDGWTIVTADGSLSAHFEHTIVITKNGPIVATRRPSEK